MPQIENKVKELKKISWENVKKFELNGLKDITKRDVSKLKKSIIKRGFFSPLMLWENLVFDGAGRVLALKELEKEGCKIPEIPCQFVEAKNLAEAKIYALQMSSQHGEITPEGLNEFVIDIPEVEKLTDEVDFYEFDQEFGEVEAEEIEPEAKEDDFETPNEIKTDIVKGDLFEFRKGGKVLHRLMCGDSTDIGDVEKLMGGEKADLAHNDPPYGMKKEKDGVKNDNLNFDDLLQFNKDWINSQFAYLKENGSFYCWGIDQPLMDIYSEILKPLIKTQKATFRNLITWDKGNAQGQLSDQHRMYPVADEKCLFVMCGVQGFNNNADNYFEGWEGIREYFENEIKKIGKTDKQIANDLGYKDGRTVNHWWAKSQWNFPTEENYKKLQTYCQQNNIDAFKKEYDELKKEYYSIRAYFDNTHDNQNNVWHFERTSNDERAGTAKHATPKPIQLCERAIKSSCPDNGLVIDFFLGSGSTMVASHQLNRRCFGLELEPKYCQVSIDRMKKLDPELEIVKV